MKLREKREQGQKIYAMLGMIVALLLLLGAFTIPIIAEPPEDLYTGKEELEDVQIEIIEPTIQRVVPKNITVVTPNIPPIEIPDEKDIIEDIIEELEINIEDEIITSLDPVRQTGNDSFIVALPKPPPPLPTEDSVKTEPPPIEEIYPPDAIFEVVESAPELIGGLDELQSRVVYPEIARRAGIEGKIYIQMIVNSDGSVTVENCFRSPNRSLCDAAIKAVEESRFIPGTQRGRPVRVRYTLPVEFKLR